MRINTQDVLVLSQGHQCPCDNTFMMVIIFRMKGFVFLCLGLVVAAEVVSAWVWSVLTAVLLHRTANSQVCSPYVLDGEQEGLGRKKKRKEKNE
eukprot:m.167353 g.167353  ORF g.167353 m.167353 type:complete len:94 (+) comp21125_c3_seq2:1540-1821(+)